MQCARRAKLRDECSRSAQVTPTPFPGRTWDEKGTSKATVAEQNEVKGTELFRQFPGARQIPLDNAACDCWSHAAAHSELYEHEHRRKRRACASVAEHRLENSYTEGSHEEPAIIERRAKGRQDCGPPKTLPATSGCRHRAHRVEPRWPEACRAFSQLKTKRSASQTGCWPANTRRSRRRLRG
jgi:hypothetical protein